MRNALLAGLCLLAVPAFAGDLTVRAKASRASVKRNAELIVKMRNRLAIIDTKNSRVKLQDDADAIRKSLESADSALAAQASDEEAGRVIAWDEEPPKKTVNHKLEKRKKQAEPVDASVKQDPKPSPRPDPKLLAHDCASLECKAAEGAAKGGLGSLRAGASIFYGDTEGTYPADLSALVPKYVDAIPAIAVGGHQKTKAVRVVTNAAGKSAGAYVEDTGGWLYFRTPGNSDLDGQIVIDCSHADYKGRPFWGF